MNQIIVFYIQNILPGKIITLDNFANNYKNNFEVFHASDDNLYEKLETVIKEKTKLLTDYYFTMEFDNTPILLKGNEFIIIDELKTKDINNLAYVKRVFTYPKTNNGWYKLHFYNCKIV